MSTVNSRDARPSDRWWDQLATVVELACNVDDRGDTEQRHLLRVAARVDRERAKDTTTNPRPLIPYLEEMVDQSRELYDNQRRVVPPSEQKARRKT